jgi:hypothetical protein
VAYATFLSAMIFIAVGAYSGLRYFERRERQRLHAVRQRAGLAQ